MFSDERMLVAAAKLSVPSAFWFVDVELQACRACRPAHKRCCCCSQEDMLMTWIGKGRPRLHHANIFRARLDLKMYL
jgi:hypothetical protein